MEKRIINKINTSQSNFKNLIKKWLDEKDGKLVINDKDKTNDFLEYLFNLNINTLEPSDFEKRKRIKNHVPQFDQCNAKKANNTRCSRRKQHNSDFCGTHIKGTPHGIIENDNTICKKKIEVWVQDIKGINSYIDSNNNVYKPEDIISNKENPDIIAKWEINENGDYCIPNFNI
tara:strand:+ start:1221 stop:1742 length:522 start_codon:yes stop_codon:yes gene_type:complete